MRVGVRVRESGKGLVLGLGVRVRVFSETFMLAVDGKKSESNCAYITSFSRALS